RHCATPADGRSAGGTTERSDDAPRPSPSNVRPPPPPSFEDDTSPARPDATGLKAFLTARPARPASLLRRAEMPAGWTRASIRLDRPKSRSHRHSWLQNGLPPEPPFRRGPRPPCAILPPPPETWHPLGNRVSASNRPSALSRRARRADRMG